jgi:hypothetical protein
MSNEERAELLKLLRAFYDTRSKVIHGTNLKAKHQTLLRRVDELRNIVKRLLVAFIRLGNRRPDEYEKDFWQEKLDRTLVNTVERERLRVALGLSARAFTGAWALLDFLKSLFWKTPPRGLVDREAHFRGRVQRQGGECRR